MLVYHWAPAAATAKNEGWHLSPHQFGLLQTFLTTVLSIGAISLLFEFLLRRSWATDLLHFLRLNVVVARSGVQHVGSETTVEWDAPLARAVEIRALVRDPSKWFLMNLPHVLRACQQHSASVLVGVPDPDGPNFPAIAECVGLTAPQLKQNIEVAIGTVENQWGAQKPHLNDGSVIRVVTYPQIPLYDVISIDNATFCVLSRPIRHALGDYGLVFEFMQDSPQYPADWLRESLASLENENELLLRDKNT